MDIFTEQWLALEWIFAYLMIFECLVPPLRLHYHERNHGQAQAWSFAGPSLPSKRTASLKAAMGSWQDGVQDPKDDLKLRVIAIFVLLIVRSSLRL